MKVHELKTWPRHFFAIWNGVKKFEMRKDDRGFAIGDILHLKEWEPSLMYGVNNSGEYTGRSLVCKVTYILGQDEEQPEFIADGWVVMSIEMLTKG